MAQSPAEALPANTSRLPSMRRFSAEQEAASSILARRTIAEFVRTRWSRSSARRRDRPRFAADPLGRLRSSPRLDWSGNRGSPAALLDPAVLQSRDFLACLGVDVEHGEDHHERLVLPLRDVEGLAGDGLVQDDRVRGQPRLGALDGRGGTQLGRAEAKDRLVGYASAAVLSFLNLTEKFTNSL